MSESMPYPNVPRELNEQIQQRYPSENDGYTPDQVAMLIEHPPTNFDLQSAIEAASSTAGILTAVWGIAGATKERREGRKLQISQDFNAAIADLNKPESRLAGINTLSGFLREEREDYYEPIFKSMVFKFRERDVKNKDPEYRALYQELKDIFVRSASLLREKLGIEELAKRAATDRTETKQHKKEYTRVRKNSFNASGCKFDGLDFEQDNLSYLLLDHASFDALDASEPPLEPDDDEDPRTDQAIPS